MNFWFFHPYYISNFLLCIMYPILRYYKLTSDGLNFKDSWGYTKENHLIAGFLTLIIIRFAKYYSNFKKFINEIIMYAKSGTAMMFFFIDIRILCWYLFTSLSK